MTSGDGSIFEFKTTIDRNEPVETATPPQSKTRSSSCRAKSRPTWEAWCERNSKPVKRPKPCFVSYMTRWKKPGPMTKKEWKNFCSWALLRAGPRETEPPKRQEEPCLAKYLPCAWPKRRLDKDELEEKIKKLATPRKITGKYNGPVKSPAYSPVVSWGEPPHRDPGRPFKPPRVPCCFLNEELEAEFWSQLRFPVRQAALLGQATPRIMNLSKPRIYPIARRPLGPLDVPPPPRKKFTRRGWQLHQLRLIYLSQPVSRSGSEYYLYIGCPCCPCSNKKR
ncbi:uncharacterized protein [Drosophila kikkawai]|uniref:Uncharacterized protein n=1 Tax=Drosophila kikkawai TaxID=30033 RepID=A0A6P4J544_DROKI|nr:uncharacterized protein LOC108084353 [Drosophila kikkawai]